jgi:hypothetical protein
MSALVHEQVELEAGIGEWDDAEIRNTLMGPTPNKSASWNVNIVILLKSFAVATLEFYARSVATMIWRRRH